MTITNRIRTRDDLNQMAKLVAAQDARLAYALQLSGPLALQRQPATFASVLNIIVGQQVSTASAAAIWRRIETKVTPLTPAHYLSLNPTQIDELGMTQQKKIYAKGLAQAVVNGDLNLRRLHRLEDEEAISRLCEMKGIGRWTAEVFALFALGRVDVLPTGDLALQEAARSLYEMTARPSAQDFENMGLQWAPYRGIAAHILWAYYRYQKEFPKVRPV